MTVDEYYDVADVAHKLEQYLRDNDLWTSRSDPYLVAQRYRQVVLKQVGQHWTMRSRLHEKTNQYLVSLEAVERQTGYYGPRGKQKPWLAVLNKLCPLYTVVKKGNNLSQSLSEVQLMFDYNWEQQWVATIADTIKADPDANKNYTWADIDIENLGNYMLRPGATQREIQEASKIIAVAEQFKIDDRWGRLPMLNKPASSGRMYYGGINLQNCPSGVRHAALGSHFSYDLRTSVFAWQVSMMRVLFNCDRNTPPPSTSYTREYIADKERIRAQFTDCFKDSYLSEYQIKGVVKQALTAISFGARRSAAYIDENNELQAHGLAGIIKHKESREAFLKHPWMVEFLNEQDYITEQIYGAVKDMFADEPACQYKGRQNVKRTMAFLYQRAEARAMRDLMDYARDKGILLWVHDGFCTRHRCSLQDLTFILEQDHALDWTIDETVHRGWVDPNNPKLSKEQQRILNEQQDKLEREQRHQTEIEMWASRGHNINNIRNQPLPVVQFKNNAEGHYSNGVSDYDAGRDPYANSNRGPLSEQQFIKRIYGN